MATILCPEFAITIEIGERLASLEGKIDTCLERQQELKVSVHELKQGIGQKVEEQGKGLAVMEERVGLMTKVGWAIFSTALGSIVLAILGLVIKKNG